MSGSDRQMPKAGLRGITRVGRAEKREREECRSTGRRPAVARKGCLDGTWAAGPSSNKKRSQPQAVRSIVARGIVTGMAETAKAAPGGVTAE